MAILIGLIALFLVFLPSVFLAYELIAGSFIKRKIGATVDKRSPVVVLMPAHNEELVIGATLERLCMELSQGDRVVVVADNCTDNTVPICHKFNVEVIERHHSSLRGKGYALAFGYEYISNDEFSTLIVLDADSIFTEGSLDRLAFASQSLDSVVQSQYLMLAPDEADLKLRFAEFAWKVKNKVRPAALNTLGLGCHIQGSGMAFPARVLKIQSFSSGSLVEDLELGLNLALFHEKVIYESEAKVLSYFSTSLSGYDTQRTRWEHGHMYSILKLFPKILLKSIKQRNWLAVGLVVDACIPPTISWLMVVIGSIFISLLLVLLKFNAAFWITLSSFGILMLSFILAWFKQGRDILSFYDLLSAPLYILGKFSLYKRFVKGAEKKWIRTDRD